MHTLHTVLRGLRARNSRAHLAVIRAFLAHVARYASRSPYRP